MSFTIVKFFYILFTTVKAFYQRQIPSVTTAIYHTIKAGLLAEVYACAKKKKNIEERQGVYGTP